MIFFVFVYVSLMIQPLYVFAELIKPSRTLDANKNHWSDCRYLVGSLSLMFF